MVKKTYRRGRALRIAVGITMLAILLLVNGAGAEDSYELVLKIPSTQQWYFDQPEEIVVDNSGNVYVAETRQNRIQKFSSSGDFLAKGLPKNNIANFIM